jgi:hypothetical protein
MKYPAEFTHRIYRTRLGFLNNNAKTLSEITKDYPGTEIDVIYENLKSVIVLVFETQEDCLAFTLKNGKEYV